MRARVSCRRGWLRLCIVAAVLGVSTGGTPSFAAHPAVSGSSRGRVLTYFHQTQNDFRQVVVLCRRQMQEETAGFRWTDKYAYDPETLGPNSFAYQRPNFRQVAPPNGEGMPAYDFSGTYTIEGSQFGTQSAPAPLTSTLRAMTYNGPPSSFAGPECTLPGPAPIIDAVVSGEDADGDKLLCRYYDGVWQRTGQNPRIVLHGICTITSTGGQVKRAPVQETRDLIPAPDCNGVSRPGTGMVGAGDCPYLMNTTVTYDH